MLPNSINNYAKTLKCAGTSAPGETRGARVEKACQYHRVKIQKVLNMEPEISNNRNFIAPASKLDL